ncbi:XdhC family protein [Paenibacillus sp. CF384]|uniref:XdhC family protein n=1 Tax=Paenibacillus sp. CF384 TaxID=1884382 RepID=UPI00210DA997|nr:XdhC family protein [Paenibacillus sp. CF384]
MTPILVKLADHRSGISAVLATIIQVSGHSYRKEGAAMLLLANGRRIGSLSPGCLEEDLHARVVDVLESGLPVLVNYNLRSEEDAIWGEAVGCGGEIKVLLEAAHGGLLRLLREAGRRLQNGQTIAFSRRWDGDRMLYTLVNDDAIVIGSDDVAAQFETDIWQVGRSIVFTWEPMPRLTLFGDGQDAAAIAKAAVEIGFRVVIADWRERDYEDAGAGIREGNVVLCMDAAFVIGTPQEIIDQLQLGMNDYLIVCSHHMRHDREMLSRAIPLGLRYIGLLGSSSRAAKLLEGLDRSSNLYAPMGLPIHAEGPQEIAISVVAQLIEVRASARQVGKRNGEEVMPR